MDEEEILSTNPIKIDTRGKFTNRSADICANNGPGKLTDAQLEERTILHAKNQMTGSPSIKEITSYWDSKYGITMAVQSEYEWAKSNQKRINLEISKLEQESGIPILATPNTAISTMLYEAGRNLSDSLKSAKKQQKSLGDSIQAISDPYKEVGAESKESYYKLSKDARKAFDDKLDRFLKINKAQTESYSLFNESIKNQSKTLVDMMKAIAELNKSGQMIDEMLKRKVRDELKDMGLKLQEKKKQKEEDPMAPVSDDDRVI